MPGRVRPITSTSRSSSRRYRQSPFESQTGARSDGRPQAALLPSTHKQLLMLMLMLLMLLMLMLMLSSSSSSSSRFKHCKQHY